MRALGFLVLISCASAGHAAENRPATAKDDLAQYRVRIAAITLCKSTEAEAIAMFGPPMRDGRLGDLRVRSWLLGEGRERVLGLLLDANGTVVDIAWDLPGLASWVPTSHCPRPADGSPGSSRGLAPSP